MTQKPRDITRVPGTPHAAQINSAGKQESEEIEVKREPGDKLAVASQRLSNAQASEGKEDVAQQILSVRTAAKKAFTLPRSFFLTSANILLDVIIKMVPYIVVGFLLFAIYTLVHHKIGQFFNLLNSVPSALSSFVQMIPTALSPIAALYCSIVGIGCDEFIDGVSRKVYLERRLSRATQLVKVQSEVALDIFQSVLALGANDAAGMNLNHVALWELSIFISGGSEIRDKEFIGDQLETLGYLTRDIRDETIAINSLSLSSFTWIVHSFHKMQHVINRAHVDKKYQPMDLDAILDSFFDKVDLELSGILTALNKVIPLTGEASELGGRLMKELEIERYRIANTERPRYQAILGLKGSKARRLGEDLDLSSKSVEKVSSLRYSLEGLRSDLMAYRNHVEHFKAGMWGSHLVSHGMSVKDEVDALREMMSRFEDTLSAAKAKSPRKKIPELDPK